MLLKISCICITYKRGKSLKRAIECFNGQVFSNKELFVVYRLRDPIASETLSPYINDREIVIYQFPSDSKITLGELRNIAINKCSRDLFLHLGR